MATNKVWQKFILKNLKSQDLKTISIKGRRYFLFIVIAGCFLVIFRDTLLSIISNDSYMSTSHLIPPITLGMFFYFLFTMYSNIPFFYRDTLLMSAPAIFAAIINIILNFIYIPKYGIIAAAYTTAISYFFQFLIIYFICTKKYNIDILFNASKK
jgi:O-antigen/teichoic acid export membrane protein